MTRQNNIYSMNHTREKLVRMELENMVISCRYWWSMGLAIQVHVELYVAVFVPMAGPVPNILALWAEMGLSMLKDRIDGLCRPFFFFFLS